MAERTREFPAAALPLLRCPLCGAGFTAAEGALRCSHNHSYDVARQGYVNLLPGDVHPGTADTAQMVDARARFLSSGHFSALREFVCSVAERAVMEIPEDVATASVGPGGAAQISPTWSGPDGDRACILEVGAGTGYYLAGVLDRLPGLTGLALDISKFAVRRAARAHERMAAVVCDAWSALPVVEECAVLVLDVFAPRNPVEFLRVLRPNGVLLVVTPTPRHLHELIGELGMIKVDARKAERLDLAFGPSFVLDRQTEYEELIRLPAADAATLVAMGPTAHHLAPDELSARLAAAGTSFEVTVSVVASAYARRRP